MKTYSELKHIPTYEEKLEYLQTGQRVGMETFGYNRYLNQALYTSPRWRQVKARVIARDNGCDLGCPDRPIVGEEVVVHHINPITEEDILNRNPIVFDPNNLVTTSAKTHRKIHYKSMEICKASLSIHRTPGDTKLW